MPGSPCLSKTGPVVGLSFSIFGSLLRTKGSLARVLSQPGAKVVCWRLHLAGTWQYYIKWTILKCQIKYTSSNIAFPIFITQLSSISEFIQHSEGTSRFRGFFLGVWCRLYVWCETVQVQLIWLDSLLSCNMTSHGAVQQSLLLLTLLPAIQPFVMSCCSKGNDQGRITSLFLLIRWLTYHFFQAHFI